MTLTIFRFQKSARHILHFDATLPGRLEAYEFQVKHEKKGLWSSDPPKVLADVVEALIGVAHFDGGMAQGQKAARNAINDMLKAVDVHFTENQEFETSMTELMHPVQLLSETCSSLKSRSCSINEFCHSFKTPVWFGKSWENCTDESTPHGNVGHINFHDLNLCTVADKYSLSVAKMKASSLLHFVLSNASDLKAKLEEMGNALD